MKKAYFSVNTWINYHGVPIPDNLKTSKDIIDYLINNLQDYEKYKEAFPEFAAEPIYQVILEDENGNESTITIDD